MPWSPQDATRHTKKAKSATAKRQWSDVADKVLEKSGDEGRAIREANAVVARRNMHADIAKFRGTSSEHSFRRPVRKTLRRTV